MRLRLKYLLPLALGTMALGCGGGGGGAKTQHTTGTVVLPSGFAPTPASLTTATLYGTAPVGSDGRFTAVEPAGGGPATVNLTDPSGKLVLLGHVDTDKPAFNDISPASTAQELLFLSAGFHLLPRTEWANAYRLLAAAPETATLASVIATRMAANPTALNDADPAIAAAVSAATASLAASPASAARATSLATRTVAQAEVQASRPAVQLATGSTTVSVQVNSTNPYLLSVAPSLDNLGIVVTNSARIHRRYFVYRVGYIPASGNLTDAPTRLTTWAPVKDGYLPATTGATGVVTSLIDYFTKKTLWGPNATPTIPLPMVPADAKANLYRVFVVGTGGPVSPPSDLAAQTDAMASVAAARKDMIALEMMKEIIWSALSKGLPANVKLWDDPQSFQKWVSLFNQLMKDLGGLEANYATQLEKGDLLPAYFDLVKAAASDPTVKTALKNAFLGMMEAALGPNGPVNAYEVVDKQLQALGAILKPADIALTSLDEGCILYELYHSTDYNDWDVRANATTITLVPPTATVSTPTQTATFSVTVTGFPSSTLTYQWGPSRFGVFTNSTGKKGDILTSVGDAVATYALTGATLPTTSDTFELEVFDPHGNSMGKVPGVVKFETNPWLGTWPGSTTSTCGYYSGPQTLVITSPGGNKLDFGVGYGGTFNGNTASSYDGVVVFTLSGDTISGYEANSCQHGTYTRQK